MSNSAKEQEKSYIQERIPSSQKKSWIGVAAIYFGMTAAISSFSAGGGLITGLNLTNSFISAVAGIVLLLLIFFIPLGFIGAREGYNTYLIGEYIFGKKATNLITGLVIAVLPGVGWYAVQVSIAAEAVNQMFTTGNLTNLFIIVLGILFVIPALFGITSMSWLDYISIPAILLITILGFVKVISISSLSDAFAYVPSTNQSIFWGINLIIGASVAGACFSPDYTRWIKGDVKTVTYTGATGIIAPKVALTAVGSMMALTATTIGVDEPWDISQVLAALGLPGLSMILIVLLQWTTTIVAAYSAGIALTKAVGWSRFWWTFIVAIIGVILALFGIIKYFIPFLNILAAFVSPVAAIIITEYFFINKRKLTNKGSFYWPSIIFWFVGGCSAFIIPFFIPAINSFIVSMVGYYLYHKFTSKTKEIVK
ncbi:purine-cytosine permease family protein [Oceanobacillus oncorhynchi subsp. oncorhynchi]|uniref:purine-cytosine permease family protein n=1 Tax=Oceanobacillus oncorhynchi TaxID=545501 RepID=UPI00363DF86A